MGYQKWEYLTIYRSREISSGLLSSGAALKWNRNIPEELSGLGDAGWELVAITPRSGDASSNNAGFTNEELWVFKRPKDDAVNA